MRFRIVYFKSLKLQLFVSTRGDLTCWSKHDFVSVTEGNFGRNLSRDGEHGLLEICESHLVVEVVVDFVNRVGADFCAHLAIRPYLDRLRNLLHRILNQ